MSREEGAADDANAAASAESETEPPAHGQGDYQVLADSLLASLVEGRTPENAALALAVLVNRAGTRLHTLARGEAGARKAQPEWPAWAQLQNASRNLLLQASTCRDLAARLAGRRQ